jgi:repressor LexA
MPTTLSKRLKETLKFIRNYSDENGMSPTIKEIADKQNIAPPSALAHIQRLEESGFIERTPKQWRSIRVKDATPIGEVPVKRMMKVPVIGRVAAGVPILAEENIECCIPVDPSVGQSGGKVFALRVKGDSMIGANIHDGDYLIVRQQPVADNGDIVVALLGDEGTVKRLKMNDDEIQLIPENPKYKPTKLKQGDEFRIVGKALAIYRMTKTESLRN